MAFRGAVNYLTPLEKWNKIKPYEIAGRVPPGQPRDNFEFDSHDVEVNDARSPRHGIGFDQVGFELVPHTTNETLDTDASVSRHIMEMESFILQHLNVDLVLTFQYQIRKGLPDLQDPRVRPPSNFVHIDLSPGGAEARVRFSFPNQADDILGGNYRLLSLWRPLFSPLKDRPLALCDTRTVNDSDLVESDYLYPNFESESLLVKHSPAHRWFYFPNQTREELLIITNFDSKRGQRVPHTGVYISDPGEAVRPRESIEIKVVVWSKQ